MNITNEDLVKQVKKISAHLHASGGIFGDSTIPDNRNIYLSMSEALISIGEYCDEFEINVTELDSIKLLVFALPFMKKRDPSMNSERYILSIFKLLEHSYQKTIGFNQQINNSIRVCDELFHKADILVVYGYIKGFQEALEYTTDQ